MRLSIVIPAYNEEERIKNTLTSYYNFFSKEFGKNFEIIVIVNGSNDGTQDIVKNLSSRHRHLKFNNFPEKIGKGGAIIEGFKIANGDFIGFVDADMATTPSAFYDLIRNLGNYDGVVASRWIRGAKIDRKQPLSRRIASRGFNIIVRLLFNITIRDTQCGAKLFTKDAVKSVVNDLGITQWGFDVDLLYKLKKKNFKVNEIPTVWNDREGSKLKIGRTSWQMFLSVARLRLIYSRFRSIVNVYDKIHDYIYKK